MCEILLDSSSHHVIGAPFIDAAKIMKRGFDSTLNSKSDSSEAICLMGKNSLISQRLFFRDNIYDRLLKMHDLEFDLNLSLNEELSPLILLRQILDSNSHDLLIYRPHPCSSSIELESFLSSISHNSSPNLTISRASTEPIYSFLSDISYIFHPGCSVSLQVVYFGIKQ